MIPENAIPKASPPRLSQVLRAVLAFLIGILIFTACILAFSKAAGIEAPTRAGEEKPAELLLCLAAAIFLAGYLAARIAGIWEVPLAAGLAALLSIGAGPAHLSWQGIESPLSQLVSLLVLVPSSALGGLAARGARRVQQRRRAEMPLALPLVIRQRVALVWLAFFLAAGMTAAAVWVYRTGEAPQVGLSGTLFFGAAALFMGWRGLRPKAQAVLRDEGVELPLLGITIPWSEIVDAGPSPMQPIEYVRFKLRNGEHYVNQLAPLQRALTQTGEREPNFGIPLTGTPYTAEEICALIRTRIH